MKLTLSTSRTFYNEEHYPEMEKLKLLGFVFKKSKEIHEEWYKTVPANHPSKARWSSFDGDPNEWEIIPPLPVKEFKSIEELQEFINIYGEIILNRDSLEIYNYYRE